MLVPQQCVWHKNCQSRLDVAGVGRVKDFRQPPHIGNDDAERHRGTARTQVFDKQLKQVALKGMTDGFLQLTKVTVYKLYGGWAVDFPGFEHRHLGEALIGDSHHPNGFQFSQHGVIKVRRIGRRGRGLTFKQSVGGLLHRAQFIRLERSQVTHNFSKAR